MDPTVWNVIVWVLGVALVLAFGYYVLQILNLRLAIRDKRRAVGTDKENPA